MIDVHVGTGVSVAQSLAETISAELKAFGIDCQPEVAIEAIALPENKSKFKRFNRDGGNVIFCPQSLS